MSTVYTLAAPFTHSSMLPDGNQSKCHINDFSTHVSMCLPNGIVLKPNSLQLFSHNRFNEGTQSILNSKIYQIISLYIHSTNRIIVFSCCLPCRIVAVIIGFLHKYFGSSKIVCSYALVEKLKNKVHHRLDIIQERNVGIRDVNRTIMFHQGTTVLVYMIQENSII